MSSNALLDESQGQDARNAEAVPPHVLPLGHYFEIFRRVVPLVSIDVMDDLARPQRPTQLLFGDDAVFMAPQEFTVRAPRTAIPLSGTHFFAAFSRHAGVKFAAFGCLPDAWPRTIPRLMIAAGRRECFRANLALPSAERGLGSVGRRLTPPATVDPLLAGLDCESGAALAAGPRPKVVRRAPHSGACISIALRRRSLLGPSARS